jgi:anti-sigma factor RsiW
MASELEQDEVSELAWLALRYVSGEMARDEAEAFESRLDQDQAAREAVAQVVEIAGAVAALPPARAAGTLPFRRRAAVRTFLAAATLAAAACLAWLAIDLRGPVPLPPQPRRTTANTPAATVALTWSSLHQEREAEKDDTSGLLAWNEDLPVPAETEDASDTGLPPWLVDAASLAGRPEHAGVPAKDL